MRVRRKTILPEENHGASTKDERVVVAFTSTVRRVVGGREGSE